MATYPHNAGIMQIPCKKAVLRTYIALEMALSNGVAQIFDGVADTHGYD